jgi:hypothetical protein
MPPGTDRWRADEHDRLAAAAVGVAGTMARDAAAAVFDMDRGQAERAPHLGRQVGDTVAEASSLFCTEGIKFKLWRSWKAWKFAGS